MLEILTLTNCWKMSQESNPPPISQVDVMGHTYAVGFIDNMSEDEMGRCHTTTQNIYLRADLPVTLSKSVLLHEILHAVHWLSDLDDASTEEAFTSRVATNLRCVMLTNPAVRDWIFS